MSLPQPNSDATVVVTGASSGIGTELARGLARRGYPLLLTARRRERLSELSDELRAKHSVTVEVMPLDLRNRAARAQLTDRIGSAPIAGLCNSAGFGTSGRFHRLPVQHEREEITVNALALMELTHAALPEMVDRGAGAFVQTFSEAVHEELHSTGVSCTVLSPGPVPTEWADVADAHQISIPIAQVSPGEVAEAAIDGMLEGKRSVVPGLVPNIVGLAGRFTPRSVLLPAVRLFNAPRT